MHLNLSSCRFVADSDLLREVTREPSVKQSLEIRDAVRRRQSLRASLLGNAVRVDSRVVPHLAAACTSLAQRLPELGSIETYVFNNPMINAFVTRGRSRLLVGLSSAAVNSLSETELTFIIGHELGHAVFDHTEIDVNGLTTQAQLEPRVCMRLRAWQRAAEISADRAGLMCCASLEAAASALFKSVSGLVVADLEVRPEEFAGQWRHLADEVAGSGSRDQWEFSHPFPPLRMMAMLLYWRASEGRDASQELAAVEAKISQMLALMDPTVGDTPLGDALLSGYFFWGGLYIALADGRLDPQEISRLQSVAPPGEDVESLASDPDACNLICIERFRESVKTRRKKLSAVEQHRIVYGLIDVAAADGHIDDSEVERLNELGKELGIPAAGCNLIAAQYREESRNVD